MLVGADSQRGRLACIFKGIVALHGWDRGTVVALSLGGGIGRGKGHCREEAHRALTIELVWRRVIDTFSLSYAAWAGARRFFGVVLESWFYLR